MGTTLFFVGYFINSIAFIYLVLCVLISALLDYYFYAIAQLKINSLYFIFIGYKIRYYPR